MFEQDKATLNQNTVGTKHLNSFVTLVLILMHFMLQEDWRNCNYLSLCSFGSFKSFLNPLSLFSYAKIQIVEYGICITMIVHLFAAYVVIPPTDQVFQMIVRWL